MAKRGGRHKAAREHASQLIPAAARRLRHIIRRAVAHAVALLVTLATVTAALAGAVTTTRPAEAGLQSCTIPPAVAHRGGSERYTENSLKAYDWAYKFGITTWETDVRFDRRGVPILMHDATLDRTTNGRGQVAAIDVAATALRLDDGQRIPTLEQFLELARARGAYAFVEFKTEPTRAQLGAAIAIVNRLGMRDRILINSFDAGRLARIRAVVGSDVDYSWVASSGAQSVAAVSAAGGSFNKQVASLARAQLDAYVAAGIRTYGWTLDEPRDWAPVRTWPLAGVVTNRPVAYQAWRAWVCGGREFVDGGR